MWFIWIAIAIIMALAVYDLTQRQRAILRNFPIIGHFRYWLEAIGPELRQYIVTSNDEERPFNRDQRQWIYAGALKQNSYFGFGTDNKMETTPNYLIIKQAAFPMLAPQPGDADYDQNHLIPCLKTLGGYRGRTRAFRPSSVINISAMSYGSLSGAAVEALKPGAVLAGCLHNTGEGGISPHHLHGGDLVWQIGTSYFGCRRPDGQFDMTRLKATVARYPQGRAIEIKLSQGAKPGIGGMLPGEKVTPEIAAIRGIPVGEDCISPNAHTAFHDVDSMLDFAECIADVTGLPVGIKSAVGEIAFRQLLAKRIAHSGHAVDFITIDGGEGGTGAAPLAFSDHVSLPFKMGFSRVYRTFMEQGLNDELVFIGSGKLGLPESALLAFGLGCDMVAVAREAMLSIGCIQAQRCHEGHCPTGVATQNRWFVHGLDPKLQATHFAAYITLLRKELLRLSRACGVSHPAQVGIDNFEILDGQLSATPAATVFGYDPNESWAAKIDSNITYSNLEQVGAEFPYSTHRER